MAGLVPAIHVFPASLSQRRRCPAPVYAKASPGWRAEALAEAAGPGMTENGLAEALLDNDLAEHAEVSMCLAIA
jgi:hypothetical protein